MRICVAGGQDAKAEDQCAQARAGHADESGLTPTSLPRNGSGVIHELGPGQTLFTRAVCAAEELSVSLHAVAEDAALTVDTDRGHLLGGALDAVEDVDRPSCGTYLERLLVVVVAYLAHGHGRSFLAAELMSGGACPVCP